MTKLELTKQVLNLIHNDSKEVMVSKVWNHVMFCGESKAINFVECLINNDLKKASSKFSKEELTELVEVLELDKEDENQSNEELFNNLKEGHELVTEDSSIDMKQSVITIRNFIDTLPKDLLKVLFYEKEKTIKMSKVLNYQNLYESIFYKLLVLNTGFKLESLNLL